MLVVVLRVEGAADEVGDEVAPGPVDGAARGPSRDAVPVLACDDRLEAELIEGPRLQRLVVQLAPAALASRIEEPRVKELLRRVLQQHDARVPLARLPRVEAVPAGPPLLRQRDDLAGRRLQEAGLGEEGLQAQEGLRDEAVGVHHHEVLVAPYHLQGRADLDPRDVAEPPQLAEAAGPVLAAERAQVELVAVVLRVRPPRGGAVLLPPDELGGIAGKLLHGLVIGQEDRQVDRVGLVLAQLVLPRLVPAAGMGVALPRVEV
mmetsp:Transcript_49756/g.133186  ORF Transcript_49756/g.133186 Transcript_49756/m.133186 type:complete len:262 (-) Transcript_49756:236-1021(-)